MHPILRLAVLALALPSAASLASDAELLHCRQIEAAEQRLACYDAIEVRASHASPGTVPEAAPAPAPSPPAPGGTRFGLPEQERAADEEQVRSRLPADFAGWGPNRRLRLENGQVWQVVDNSSFYTRAGARDATVRRGMLGTYYLEIEGINRSPKVKRIE